MNSRKDEIRKIYFLIRTEIERKLEKFKKIWLEANDLDIFAELVFCLLTPQSRAKSCWIVVENLLLKDLLLKGGYNEINKELKRVRFKNRKTQYILIAREYFITGGKISIKEVISSYKGVYQKREGLVEKIKGLGYKEASHFLRNIGFGEDIAILDRHILNNLNRLNVIEEIPNSLTKKRYIEIENKMKNLALDIEVPLDHLDFVLWFMETGEIFK